MTKPKDVPYEALEEVPFQVVSDAPIPPAADSPSRVHWQPFVAALLEGKTLYIATENLSTARIRHLRRSTARQAGGRKLRLIDVGGGYLLWLDPMTELTIWEMVPHRPAARAVI